MGQRLAVFMVCALAIALSARLAAQSGRASTTEAALEYFATHTDEAIDTFLTRLRPAPLAAAACGRVIAGLPKEGELQPSRSEVKKITEAERILEYSARKGVITVKVIDLPHAFVGLYDRAVLLASRHALTLVSEEEFAALVAHEVAHEYVWAEYAVAIQRFDHKRMRQLELHCDGIAVLALRRVGIDPERLVSAVQMLTRFNRFREATENRTDYVPLKERVTFIRAVAKLPWRTGQSPAKRRVGSRRRSSIARRGGVCRLCAPIPPIS